MKRGVVRSSDDEDRLCRLSVSFSLLQFDQLPKFMQSLLRSSNCKSVRRKRCCRRCCWPSKFRRHNFVVVRRADRGAFLRVFDPADLLFFLSLCNSFLVRLSKLLGNDQFCRPGRQKTFDAPLTAQPAHAFRQNAGISQEIIQHANLINATKKTQRRALVQPEN